MKKTLYVLGFLALISLLIIAPASAFVVTEYPSYSPEILTDGTRVHLTMTICYNSMDTIYGNLFYQTQLTNVSWHVKIYHGESQPLSEFNYNERAGSIPWFTLYYPNSQTFVEFTLDGDVTDYGSGTVSLLHLYDTLENGATATEYQVEPVPIYDKSQNVQNFYGLKEQLDEQKAYVIELKEFTNTQPLDEMIANYETTLSQYSDGQIITRATYDNLVANMDSIVKSVRNYQSPLVENNLKSVSSFIQDTSYYNDFQVIYKKWQDNDFSNQLVTQSYLLAYYAITEYQNKENIKTAIIFLVILVVVGGVVLFLIMRKKNREKLEEIF